MKSVFFGTPQFAADVLEYLIDNQIQIAAVVTRTDKAKGRSGKPVPTPVKALVQSKAPEIPVFQPEKASSPDFAETLSSFHADLFIVVAYGEILKENILSMPKIACINLHTSLLPKYRGAAPIQRCIINGERETGVTIMHMSRKMDAGDAIKSIKVPIGKNDSFGEVEQLLCSKGKQLLLEVIQENREGVFPHTPQDDAQVTFAPKIELEDCQIHWQDPAEKIHNLVRGVNPYPGAWSFVLVKGQKKRLKIAKTMVEGEMQGKPGDILSLDSDGMVVACGKGSVKILKLQLEGKKPMTPEELFRGVSISFFIEV